ncbi:MAG: hypothetical protein ACQES2_06555 [Pseudomonadota bacterium]
MKKSIEELVRIAAAGGGVRVDGGALDVDELVRIVAAGGAKKTEVIIANADAMKTDGLVRVAAAGQGRVSFDFT